MKDDGKTPDSENGGANVFARSGKLQRSPASNQVTTASSSSSIPQVEQHGSQGEQLGQATSNGHQIRHSYGRSGTEEWRRRAEAAEKALFEAKENAKLAEAQETPKGPTNLRQEKRDRETPGDEEDLKKHKDDVYGDNEKKEQKKKEEEEKKNEEEEKKKKTEERKKEVKKKENPRHRRERSKGDANELLKTGRVKTAASQTKRGRIDRIVNEGMRHNYAEEIGTKEQTAPSLLVERGT
ncbi:uncharacterized protein LOC135710443 [Ochlerotatus camptorhynchus]|uniref:uncharacterized protein LOC135710443 n=1 Tax=Ochlerotatus camptorhynchus TaxID=644619 RepID=UPI0031D5F41C